MRPREVLVDEVQGDGGGEVLDLLGEGVGESGEAAHAHPHGEVLALYVGRADVARVGVAGDDPHVGAGADGGAVAALLIVAVGSVVELCSIA